MGYPTRIQVIKRGNNQQWYVNFPAAIARAMNFKKSEVVEWEIIDKRCLKLKRRGGPKNDGN
ncbi:MAG TPA: hypothetical protein DCK87_01490 [Desulfotomaculum sp.]|nr:hypothetical protein [Desulfotomaculum sp.]